MVVENPLRDPQSQSGAGFALGCDEGVKQALEHVAVHAGAVVGDGDDDALACLPDLVAGRTREDEAALFRQGIEGIRNQVGENLLNLSGLAQNWPAQRDSDVRWRCCGRGSRDRGSRCTESMTSSSAVNAGAVR